MKPALISMVLLGLLLSLLLGARFVERESSRRSFKSTGRILTGVWIWVGFRVVTDVATSGVLGSKGEFSWGGLAGTIFWVDPKQDMVAIAMIQLMGSPWPLRSDFKVATNQAIVGPAD